MNKTFLIAGGASAASLAVGATAGFLYARKKFNLAFETLVELEVNKTKHHYEKLLEHQKGLSTLRSDSSAAKVVNDPARFIDSDAPLKLEAEDTEEESQNTLIKLREKGERLEEEAEKARVNYQGFAQKPELKDVVSHNIFTTEADKRPKLPPRGPGGKFLSKTAVENTATVTAVKDDVGLPYEITSDVFLLNEPEYEQESLLYFVKEKTLLLVADDSSVELDVVGEHNLKNFPEDEEPSVIYVRNDGLGMDYQVTRTEESLVDHMGLGESDSDMPDEYDGQD